MHVTHKMQEKDLLVTDMIGWPDDNNDAQRV